MIHKRTAYQSPQSNKEVLNDIIELQRKRLTSSSRLPIEFGTPSPSGITNLYGYCHAYDHEVNHTYDRYDYLKSDRELNS